MGTGVPRRAPQSDRVGHLRAAVREGPQVRQRAGPALIDAILGGWRLGGIFQARSGLPITVTDGRARSLQGERGSERPNCVGDWKPTDQSITRWLDINAFAGGAARHVRQLPGGGRARARLHQPRSDAVEAVRVRRPALRRVPDRGVQRAEPSELRAAGARHLGAEHVRDDHQHRSARRASIELVFKFYF